MSATANGRRTTTSYPELVDVQTASEILGVSKRHIYNLVNRGEIKGAKFGRVVRVNLASVMEAAELGGDARDGARKGASEMAFGTNGLLPCPFCGGVAELKHTKTWDYFVRCQSCGARTRQHHENSVGAVDDWNRRAES